MINEKQISDHMTRIFIPYARVERAIIIINIKCAVFIYNNYFYQKACNSVIFNCNNMFCN